MRSQSRRALPTDQALPCSDFVSSLASASQLAPGKLSVFALRVTILRATSSLLQAACTVVCRPPVDSMWKGSAPVPSRHALHPPPTVRPAAHLRLARLRLRSCSRQALRSVWMGAARWRRPTVHNLRFRATAQSGLLPREIQTMTSGPLLDHPGRLTRHRASGGRNPASGRCGTLKHGGRGLLSGVQLPLVGGPLRGSRRRAAEVADLRDACNVRPSPGTARSDNPCIRGDHSSDLSRLNRANG